MALKPSTTPVIFRRDPKSESGNVVAIFPRDPGTADPRTCSMYQHHHGQHCSGRPDLVIRKTKPAYLHEDDVQELKRELDAEAACQAGVSVEAYQAARNAECRVLNEAWDAKRAATVAALGCPF